MSSETDLRRDLIAECTFQGNANDSSGMGRHGEAHAVGFGADRFGKPDSAALFNGVDSYVKVSPPPAINSHAFSISVWVQFNAMPLDVWSNCIVAQDNGDDENPERRVFQLSCFWKHVVWHLMTDDRDPIYRRQVRLGEWYHIVATCNAGRHSLYVDGQFQDAIHRTVPESNTQPLHIGRKGTDESYFYLDGAVDDLRIFNRTLSSEDVTALFVEGGYQKSVSSANIAHATVIQGQWGRDGIVLLDLHTTAEAGSNGETVVVTGRVMDGRPGLWANVDHGSFNQRTGLLTLGGIGRGPHGTQHAPYKIIGTLDDEELTVSYDFDGSSGNLVFARSS